jgi:hypothetical protein
MQTKQFSNAPKFSKLQDFAVIVQTCGSTQIENAIEALRTDPDFQGIGWQTTFSKLHAVFTTGKPEYKIFAMGNSKLPFLAFSTLPGVTCPGAGDCLNFCYSFRAWRYPAAFGRQVQNAFLMRFNTAAIESSFIAHGEALPDGFDFRLYVDGDFSHGGDVAFWMNLLAMVPHARAYGYSKSFHALLGFDVVGQWPKNYMLNVSGGHNSSPAVVAAVKALPITRGEFIAVSIGRKVKGSDHGTPEVNKALREAFDGKAFPCPGTCSDCTGKGHACGMPQLKGLPIIIAMH